MNTLLFTPDGPWTVRDLKPADAPRVLAILRECAQWLRKKGLSQWQEFLEGGEAQVARRFQEGLVVLVERGGQDAGVMALQTADTFWDPLGHDGLALWIHSLAVRPSFTQRGLGKAMLGFAESLARARSKHCLRLDVADGNARLKTYYRNLGFGELGVQDRDGRAIRLLEKELA